MEPNILHGIAWYSFIERKANTAMHTHKLERNRICILTTLYYRWFGVIHRRTFCIYLREIGHKGGYPVKLVLLREITPTRSCYCPEGVREGREVPVLDGLELFVNRIIANILPVARIALGSFLVVPKYIVIENELVTLNAIDAEVINIFRKGSLSGTSHLA